MGNLDDMHGVAVGIEKHLQLLDPALQGLWGGSFRVHVREGSE